MDPTTLHDVIASALVPFDCTQLKSPKVVFRNSALAAGDDEHILERFGYLVPSAFEKDADFGHARKCFYAERYGGRGIGANGGGVRCGLDGDLQVKGIGANCLAGLGTDPSHANGELRLREAIRETIWGEILHAMLPYSAVRVSAILITGTRCHATAALHSADHMAEPRALVVRQAALRVGHFDLAPYFRPHPAYASSLPLDADRVRAVISQLPRALPQASTTLDSVGEAEALSYGLAEFSTRIAEQLAVSRSRRLMHGALSSSNLCLDGRWIDFGTVSALPGYANFRDIKPDFWNEEQTVLGALDNLGFCIAKYLRLPPGSAYPHPDDLKLQFETLLDRAQCNAFSILAGFPSETTNRVAARHGDRLQARLGKAVLNVARAAKPRSDADVLGLCAEASLVLRRALIALATPESTSTTSAALLTDLRIAPHLSAELKTSHREFAAANLAEATSAGIEPARYLELVRWNVRKLHTWSPMLLETQWLQGIELPMVDGDSSKQLRDQLSALVDSMVGWAESSSNTRHSSSTVVWRVRGNSITYDARAGTLLENMDGREWPVDLRRLAAVANAPCSAWHYEDFSCEFS